MANKKISELPAAGALDGTEQVPVVQGGATVRTTLTDALALGTVADDVTFTPAGSISATDVQAALAELDAEKSASTHAHSGAYELLDPDRLTVGEATYPRSQVSLGSIAMTSQTLRLSYFTARNTEDITQVVMNTANAAAAATPTLIRVGIWTADAAGALLAQVAATPNDTTLLASGTTEYTKALTAGFTKTLGQRYAVGLLVVTAQTVPQMAGHGVGMSASNARAPKISGAIAAQADLPATAAAGGVAANASRIWFALLP